MALSKRACGIFDYWFYDDNGKRQKISTRTTRKSDALKFVAEFERQREQQLFAVKNIRLKQFITEYIAYSASAHAPNTTMTVRSSLNMLLRVLGDMPLGRIRPQQLERFILDQQSKNSVHSARRHYGTIRSAFQTAIRWGYLEHNPFTKIPKPKTVELVPTFFSRQEFQTLLEHIDDAEHRDIVICAVNLGLRISELLNLRWHDIDFERVLLYVQNSSTFQTKSRRNRIVPLNKTVLAVLQRRHQASSCDLVFHRAGHPLIRFKVSQRFKRYVLKSGINPRLHFHSLRHTFGSWLVQSGASLYAVQNLMGHSTPTVTMVYAHLQTPQLQSTVEQLNFD